MPHVLLLYFHSDFSVNLMLSVERADNVFRIEIDRETSERKKQE